MDQEELLKTINKKLDYVVTMTLSMVLGPGENFNEAMDQYYKLTKP